MPTQDPQAVLCQARQQREEVSDVQRAVAGRGRDEGGRGGRGAGWG